MSVAIPHTRANCTTASNTHSSSAANVPADGKLPPHQRLNIALLGYRSHPFVGGQGIYIKYLSRALNALGHKVTVFSGPPYPQLDSEITLVKVPSLDLYEQENHVTALRWHHLKSFSDFYEWFTMLTGGFGEPYTFSRRVRKLIAPNQFDIVHDNQSLGRGLLSIQKHTPVIATIHHPIHRDRKLAIDAAPNWQHRLLRKRWYSFLTMQEKVCKKLDNLVTVSKVSQTDIARFFKRPEHSVPVVPNGVDTQVFSPNPSVKKHPFGIITTASSDQPLKGLRFLLEAMVTIKKQFPQVTLTVIGKLQEGGASDTLLKSLQLENTISFKSGLTTQALVEQYQTARIAVCPSLYEGFGLPAAEAMACGLAVVSSNGGALPEVVGDAGLVVEKGSSDAIANAIISLFSTPQKIENLGAKARERIEQTFSWHTVAQQLTQHYLKIIQTKKHTHLSDDAFIKKAPARLTASETLPHADD
ncbi:glycosyltransferase family 4 protein [Saccharophagus degradans]|uniref:Glycosyltransferase family 4 protein n=1 Tax=Saccharophagus degradans TaxID=86304 RepID=A0AAW7X3D6_9GAMM|nr:glycosyltransferase family 4 protein [Saccharophagus degradans]MDO6422054.1 glycosyltransferase family 4 protein [Saccharophagus degradans]MDO6609391.1 glycosyltransferase family 4 protein [Saccharophagus degradans]